MSGFDLSFISKLIPLADVIMVCGMMQNRYVPVLLVGSLFSSDFYSVSVTVVVVI